MESITTLLEHGHLRNLPNWTKIKWCYDTCLSYIHMYVHMKCIFHITNVSIEFNSLLYEPFTNSFQALHEVMYTKQIKYCTLQLRTVI